MKPVKTPHNPQGDLFKTELLRIIDLNHPLARLAKEVDWERLDEVFGKTYCEDNGRPAASTRLMVALHYLKYTFNLSDEDVVEAWVENPYWQHFGGNQYFEHRKLLKAASRLPEFLRPVIAHLFEILKPVLRILRSGIFSLNQLDPVFVVL